MKTNKLILFIICNFLLFSCQSKPKGETKGEPKEGSVNEIYVHSISKSDSLVFSSIKQMSAKIIAHTSSNNNRVLDFAKLFLQSKYAANTLSGNDKEQLVVNLQEFDCATFVENILAFSLIENDFTYDDFVYNLENLRYRNGKLINYVSRLHYFADWIYDNQQKEILVNISKSIGGVLINKKVDFMGKHLNLYPELEGNKMFQEKIFDIQKEINSREMYFIPQDDIVNIENKILNGDIIAITTKVNGLIVSHTGFAIFINNRLHLLHASSEHKKVIVSKIPLSDMLKRNKLQTGIIVSRLL